jgi:3-dehydroquinate dehydratase
MADQATWEKRRDGLEQVKAYYEEAVRLVAMAQEATSREDEDDLAAALMMLAELEAPDDVDIEVAVKSDKPDGFWN